MQAHLFDFRWTDPQHCEIQACVGQKLGRKTIRIGDDLSLKILSDPYCAGHWKDNTHHPCPQNETGTKKCKICRAREGSFVYTVFDGFNQHNIEPQELQLIQGPHWVYLALFDKDLVKIGVSQLDRKELRQLEQGSHFTLYIAQTPDGITARQIETLIRKKGLADKIKPSQKKDFLCPEITTQEGKTKLKELIESHKNALDTHPHLKEFLLPTPEFVDWSATYHLPQITQSSKTFQSLKLEKEESVSGKILAIKGPFVFLETPDEIIAVCLKDYNGKDIDFSPQPPGINLKTALQGALF